MRLRAFLLTFTVCALAQRPCAGQLPALTAEPNRVSPGQVVRIVWHFVGDKIVLYGGRFGRGAIVTNQKSMTDTPRVTTRYAVVVWYRPATGGRPAGPSAPRIHVRYEVVVRVETPAMEPLALYRSPGGWQLQVPAGWRHDVVRLPDAANNGLVFFQKEEDSVERLAVSFQPAPSGGSEGLMKKVRASAYTSYGDVRFLKESTTVHAGVPAAWTVFSGEDDTHPGVATQSMVLALVKGSVAYVVSALTAASRFSARAAALERMVRSFALTGKLADAPVGRLPDSAASIPGSAPSK